MKIILHSNSSSVNFVTFRCSNAVAMVFNWVILWVWWSTSTRQSSLRWMRGDKTGVRPHRLRPSNASLIWLVPSYNLSQKIMIFWSCDCTMSADKKFRHVIVCWIYVSRNTIAEACLWPFGFDQISANHSYPIHRIIEGVNVLVQQRDFLAAAP